MKGNENRLKTYIWCLKLDSNQWPTGYEPVALPLS